MLIRGGFCPPFVCFAIRLVRIQVGGRLKYCQYHLLTLLIMAVLSSSLSSLAHAQKGVFLTPEQWHQQVFPGQPLAWKTLWVNQAMRTQMEPILGHRLASLRIRYWGEGQSTAWIFEEIGKELPITVGVLVQAGQVAQLNVLEYRESRGGEVRYPFFTDQFNGARLQSVGPDAWALSQHIDGITGATLSVAALKKIAMLALFCHSQTPFGQVATRE